MLSNSCPKKRSFAYSDHERQSPQLDETVTAPDIKSMVKVAIAVLLPIYQARRRDPRYGT